MIPQTRRYWGNLMLRVSSLGLGYCLPTAALAQQAWPPDASGTITQRYSC